MLRNKINLKKLLLGLSLSFLILPQSISHASKKETSISLNNGVTKISHESRLLLKSRAVKYEQLEKDLDEFYDKGSSKISSDNMLYLLKKNDFTAEELDTGLEGTGLSGLGKDFKKAENTYGVNAILLMAMAKHETGNGTSELFLEKNNLFGFNAVDLDPYNQATDFKTPGDSIDTVAKHLKEKYLSSRGDYYNGISTDAIGKSYATDPDWSKKVNWMMIEVSNNMIDQFNQEAGK